MTRPTTHADLSSYKQRGTTLFTWTQTLSEYPEVEQHIVKAKLEARRMGFEFEYNEIRVPLTKKELDAILLNEQELFDKGALVYAGLLAGRDYEELGWSEKNMAMKFAEYEGVAHPSQVAELLVVKGADGGE